MARYLPAYREANTVNGKVMALPYYADAQFLFYRKDLLQKYGLQPPKTWDEVKTAAQKIQAGENNPNLRGFETAGAPIEGTVCTFLVPLWGAGGNLTDPSGKLTLSPDVAKKPFELWGEWKKANVIPANIAEIVTDRIRQNFAAGNVVFGMSWGYMWGRAQNDADSTVKDKVGVTSLPGLHARQARDLHRRLAGRRLGVLEEQGGGREARAVPVEPRRVEDAGRHRLSHARSSRRSTPTRTC